MEKEWKSGEAIWHMKQAERNALDVAAMNKLNEIIDVATLRQRVAELEAAVKKSNDRLNEERDIWDRMFGDGEKKLERIEIELDDCLHVLEALWMKQNTPELTDLWAKILIRNKRGTGASSAEGSS